MAEDADSPAGRSPRRALRRIAAIAAVMLGLAGSGAHGDRAADQSAAVVSALNEGTCRRPPTGIDAGRWEPMCTAVRAALTDGAVITLRSTTTEDSGEIGHAYTSVATFSGRNGAARTIRLYYQGTGFSGSDPVLTYASMDGEVLLDQPAPS